MWRQSLSLAMMAAIGFSAVLPEGPGKKTIESACASCHSLDIITSKRWTREQWESAVRKMNVPLSKEESADVIGYLSRHFGTKERSRQLVEEICSFCHELARLQGHEYTRKQWETLTKVMISEGAPVTDEESSLILDYLARNYGPHEQGKEGK